MKLFDKKELGILRNDIQNALNEVAKTHGISLNMGSISFTQTQLITKITGRTSSYGINGSDRVIDTKTRLDLARLGLPSDLIGKEFTSNGTKFTVTELSSRRPKFPVSAKSENGKDYKFTVASILNNISVSKLRDDKINDILK
jgi:hypothetical protein